MKTANFKESSKSNPPISKGLSEVWPRAGNKGDRPLVKLEQDYWAMHREEFFKAFENRYYPGTSEENSA